MTVNLDGKRVPLKQDDRVNRKGSIPYYGASGIIDYIDDHIFEGEHLLIAEDGANLVTRSKPIAFIAGGKFWVNNHAHIVQTKGHALHAFIAHFFNIFDLTQYTTGTAQPKLTQRALNLIEFPLPPLNEQRRIVAKIEALQARSNAAKQALDAIGPLLEKFRQSVLAAAFRGDLTASWREQHPDVEPASALLERIRVERKARFIAAAADKARAKAEAKARAAGKSWTEADATAVVENARAKAEAQYVEPEPVDATELPELPPGWCWASLEETAEIASGQTPKNIELQYRSDGPLAWYRVSDMNIDGNEDFMHTGAFTLTAESAMDLGLHIRPSGTIIFPKRGGAISTNKKRRLKTRAAYDLNIMGLIPASETIGEWLWAWFKTVDLSKLADGSSVPQINNSDINPLHVPIAPEPEQAKIITLVKELQVWSRQILASVQTGNRRLDQLNQSILAKAFRGELVPQDPNDEPASVLLERIRAERATSPTATKKPKPKPPAREPAPTPKPTSPPEQLDLLVHVPPERVSIEDEPTEVMATLRKILAHHTDLPRDAAMRMLAESLGYQRISANLRKRLDGHLRAAVRRRILEPGHAELLRLATHRVEDYARDDLAATLRTISRRNCVYEREELARSLLDHLGFRRMKATAKRAIESAVDAAIDDGTFEDVDAERLRRR